MIVCNGSRHGRSIVSARLRKAKLMMGMPFSDMQKTVLRKEPTPYPFKIGNVLIEKGCLVICIWARSYGEQHNGNPSIRPEPKEFPTGFDIRTI